MLSLDSGSLNKIMKGQEKKTDLPDTLSVAKENDAEDYSSSDDDKRLSSGGASSDSDSSGSSLGLDGDDEEKLYQQILSEQGKAQEMKDAKKKGEHLDDLVDAEMI